MGSLPCHQLSIGCVSLRRGAMLRIRAGGQRPWQAPAAGVPRGWVGAFTAVSLFLALKIPSSGLIKATCLTVASEMFYCERWKGHSPLCCPAGQHPRLSRGPASTQGVSALPRAPFQLGGTLGMQHNTRAVAKWECCSEVEIQWASVRFINGDGKNRRVCMSVFSWNSSSKGAKSSWRGGRGGRWLTSTKA